MQKDIENAANPAHAAVIRLLSGVMAGCEFYLSPGRNMFVMAAENTLDAAEGRCDIPDDCIVIPSTMAGINFEITCGESDAPVLAELKEFRPDGVCSRNIETSQIINAEGQIFALRRADEPWSDSVLCYRETTTPPAAPVALFRRRPVWFAALATVIAIIALVVTLNTATQHRQILSLAAGLGDENNDFPILPGRDGIMYVMTQTAGQAAWGRQALVRMPSSGPVRVVNAQDEVQRTIRWLAGNFPQLHLQGVRFDEPLHPLVALSLQRTHLNSEQKKALTNALMEIIPYASTINLMMVDDNQVSLQADAGIKKLGVTYSRHNHPDSVTFIINNELDDGERLKLRQFIEVFSQQWNGHYILFSIDAKENWLKGKSFKYGRQEYVKLNAGHWFFPNN